MVIFITGHVTIFDRNHVISILLFLMLNTASIFYCAHYSNTLEMIFRTLTVFLVGKYISVISAQSCSRKYTNRPMQGYYCNGPYQINVTVTSQHQCTHKCISDSKCRMLSYNTVRNYCLLGTEPCVVADKHPDFLLMIFRLSETEQCVSWETDNIPKRMVESLQHSPPGVVCRHRIAQDVHPGIGFPQTQENCHFTPPSRREKLAPWPDYELLSISSNCTLAWMPYTPGNILPTSAVQTGYITAVGHTYTARIYRSDLDSVKFGVYVPGESAAHYPYFGDKSSTLFDILVQVWYGTYPSGIYICASQIMLYIFDVSNNALFFVYIYFFFQSTLVLSLYRDVVLILLYGIINILLIHVAFCCLCFIPNAINAPVCQDIPLHTSP